MNPPTITATACRTPLTAGLRSCLASTPGALLVTLAISTVCALESTVAPWAPYFVVYGALALLIPNLVGIAPIRPTRLHGRPLWRITAIVAVLAIAVDSGVFTLGYDLLLQRMGLGGQAFYSISGATARLVEMVAYRTGLSPLAAQGIFGVFVLLWAPIGEELFYRGYLYGALKSRMPGVAAFVIAAVCFSARHVPHFLYLWPTVSIAGLAWALGMLCFAGLMTWLYERTGGLGPSMAVHFMVNVTGLLVAPV